MIKNMIKKKELNNKAVNFFSFPKKDKIIFPFY